MIFKASALDILKGLKTCPQRAAQAMQPLLARPAAELWDMAPHLGKPGHECRGSGLFGLATVRQQHVGVDRQWKCTFLDHSLAGSAWDDEHGVFLVLGSIL